MSPGKDPKRLPDRERPVGRAGAGRGPSDEHVAPSSWTQIPGRRLIEASWAGTAVLTVAVAAGVVALDAVAPIVVAVSGALFVGGSVAFFLGYARAVDRSRRELLGVGGIYFMSGSTPLRVRRHMMGSLAVEVAAVIVAIAVKPYSSLVFTSLAPMWALGLAGMWAARHGTFPARQDDDP